jgi:hypothetical protein
MINKTDPAGSDGDSSVVRRGDASLRSGLRLTLQNDSRRGAAFRFRVRDSRFPERTQP